MEENIIYCEACGKIVDKYGSKQLKLCSKHYQQLRRYGEIKDHNQRTVWDDNEIRIYTNYAEIDTYDQFGNVTETYKLDIEDVKYLNGHKWRTVYKGKNNLPYLVSGHTIYFHILVILFAIKNFFPSFFAIIFLFLTTYYFFEYIILILYFYL